MNKAKIVKVDGTEQELDHQPTLAEAQSIVGGYVELVKAKEDKTDRTVTLVVDEDGRLKNSPLNVTVSTWYSVNSRHFPIVGDVILLYGWNTVK
jgi:hypothetical protein